MSEFTRRDILQSIGIGTTALMVPHLFFQCQKGRNLPNIVYIMADDLGYGDVSCLNENSKLNTKHMDRIAAEGMICTDVHSGSAVCTPTRYGVLTGRYAWRTRLKRHVIWGYSPHLIDPNRMTVASLLKKNGYATACIGKWHLGMDWQTTDSTQLTNERDEPGTTVDFSKPILNGPTAVGFDYYFGISASLDMFPHVYIENDRVTALPDRETVNTGYKTVWRKGPTGADFKHIEVLPKLTEKAVEYIDTQAEKMSQSPFFLYFPLPAPHAPILPTDEFKGKSGTNEYGDFVLQVDWTIGQVMEALERNGLKENTLVIVTSDNGCSPRAVFDELLAEGHNPSYHFRGYKADIFEGGHRIPFIARWPGKIAPGTESDETLCLTDVFATCAAIVGEEMPDNAGEDSYNILPALLGEQYAEPLREATVHHSINGSFSIRQGRWKLELCQGSGGWSTPRPGTDAVKELPPIQLYDLEEDIAETRNVYDQYPEVVERLKQLLTDYVLKGRSTPGTPQRNDGGNDWPELSWMNK